MIDYTYITIETSIDGTLNHYAPNGRHTFTAPKTVPVHEALANNGYNPDSHIDRYHSYSGLRATYIA